MLKKLFQHQSIYPDWYYPCRNIKKLRFHNKNSSNVIKIKEMKFYVKIINSKALQ